MNGPSCSWGSLSPDAERRWRQNRIARRKYRQNTCSSEPPSQIELPALSQPSTSSSSLVSRGLIDPRLMARLGDAAVAPPPSAPMPSDSIRMTEFGDATTSDELLCFLDLPRVGLSLLAQQHPGSRVFDASGLVGEELNNGEADVSAKMNRPPRYIPSTDDSAAPGSPQLLDTSGFGTEEQVEGKLVGSDIVMPDINQSMQQHQQQTNRDKATVGNGSSRRPELPRQISASTSPSLSKDTISSERSSKQTRTSTSIEPDWSGCRPKTVAENREVATNSVGETALHKAAASGYKPMVQLLLDSGADIELATQTGRRAIHFASAGGHLYIVQLLVESGADFEAADHYGMRPLHLAAMRCQEDVARFLLSYGAQINARDRTSRDLED